MDWIELSGNASWVVVLLPPSCSDETARCAKTVDTNVKTGRFCWNCARNNARTVGIISHNIVVLPKPNNGIQNTQNRQQTCA